MKRPIPIGIGASHSGSGKMYLASMIPRHFTGMVVPLSPQHCIYLSCHYIYQNLLSA